MRNKNHIKKCEYEYISYFIFFKQITEREIPIGRLALREESTITIRRQMERTDGDALA